MQKDLADRQKDMCIYLNNAAAAKAKAAMKGSNKKSRARNKDAQGPKRAKDNIQKTHTHTDRRSDAVWP